MGTKFANIQIRGIQRQQADELVPDAVICQTHPDWVTLLHPDYSIGSVEKIAKKLSGKMDHTVVSIGFFDDDIFSLQVFRNQKRMLCHNSAGEYGYQKTRTNPKALAAELGITSDDVDALKWILQCEQSTKQAFLLQNLWGVQLWLDYHWINEEGNSEDDGKPFSPDRTMVNDYVQKAKTAAKPIKSTTKTMVIQEFKARVQCCDRVSEYLSLPDTGIPQLYFPDADGRLVAFGAQNLPPHNGMGCEVLRAGKYTGVYNRHSHSSRWTLYDSSGATVWSGDIDKNMLAGCLCPDGTLVLFNHSDLIAVGVDGKERWRKTIYLYTKPEWYKNAIYYHGSNATSYSEMVCCSSDGKVLGNYPLELGLNFRYGRTLTVCDDCFYHTCNILNDQDKKRTFLLRFKDIHSCNHFPLDQARGDIIMDMLPGTENSIWIRLLGNALLRVCDGNVLAHSEQTGIALLHQTDAEERLVVQKGNNGIEIYDKDLKLVGRHRVKGSLRRSWLDSKGNVCMAAYEGLDYHKEHSDCIVRVYRITS